MIFNSGGGGSATALTTQEIEDAVEAAFPVIPTYTVTISLTEPRHQGEFTSCKIYEVLDSAYTVGEQIGTISSATGSTEVSVSGSLYGFSVRLESATTMYVYADEINCTGDVTYAAINNSSYVYSVIFETAGDGTATIAMVDYDF